MKNNIPSFSFAPLIGTKAQMNADDVKTFTVTNGMKFLMVKTFQMQNMYLFSQSRKQK
jgi:hypothetical protein